MAEQIGIVRKHHSDGWAIVMTNRTGACGGCHTGAGDACRSCLTVSKMESRVANPINARTGDMVKIRLRTSELLKGAFIFYLMPVLLLLCGAFAGLWLAQPMGWNETAGAVLMGGAGLAAGVVLVVLLDRTRYVRRRMMPTITAVVTDAGRFARRHPSCCS
nr:SoxR reducing system RseC family protein [Desulfatitalea alkaliphila]